MRATAERAELVVLDFLTMTLHAPLVKTRSCEFAFVLHVIVTNRTFHVSLAEISLYMKFCHILVQNYEIAN